MSGKSMAIGLAAGFLLSAALLYPRVRSKTRTSKTEPDTDLSYPSSLPPDEKEAFIEICDQLTVELLTELKSRYELPAEASEWVKKMIEYNVKGGKLNRGLTVVSVKRTIDAAKGRVLSTREFARAAVLGWCIEWLQAFFLVADDVMDDSVTRRGQPCWFRLPQVKLIAVNDSFILESNVFQILKRHFGHEPFYVTLFDLFREVTLQTELGQLLDLTSQPMDGQIDLQRFTPQRYQLIVKYKTAFYTFYLPIACGLILSGMGHPAALTTARRVCVLMGEYFQVQDDYLDCYGDPKLIGKVGTDIQDNKCSWLVVQALAKATPAQRTVLEAHYGKHEDSSVAAVKTLYREMGLEVLFKQYEEQSYTAIQKELDALPADIPRPVFELLLKKIYRRSK
ncbi:farnesyl pyrophosphate synthase [Nannochloropsis gaditana]|uniref:Farnesyl pyrophosphate synthase n=1 Tax=Nannochloropsis gaditana TaxID=72520 RepID=W7TD59_9STRA|nr:farnesyl pyrophosphate synthase [Nannochloropsis gaditana]